jgi:hypothetical protein
LIVLEGNHSLWCGAPASDAEGLCHYGTLPGYGDNWSQEFTTAKFTHDGDVTLSFLAIWDSEPGLDFTYVYYWNKRGYWEMLTFYDWLPDGSPAQLESFVIPDSMAADTLQIRFWFFSDGAWSDEDGLWDSDGAIVIDSLRITDSSGEINFQDFEGEAVGAHVTNDGFWSAGPRATFGNYAGLFPGSSLVQEDGCEYNVSGMWAFISGSTYNYACGGFPEQAAVPMGNLPISWEDDFLHNDIWSPFIDFDEDINGLPVPSTAQTTVLEFDVYRDLPMENLVFYVWRVRGVIDGCPQPWRTDNYVYYGGGKDWYRHRVSVGGYLEPGTQQIQVALGVRDMCYAWGGWLGTCACHSHAPLFDNVRVARVNSAGPSWQHNEFSLFQDNFASNGTLTGTVRIDGSLLHPNGAPRDSVMIRVTSNVGTDYHIPGERTSGPAVYCHVKDIPPVKQGNIVSGDLTKYPVVAHSGGWTKVQCYTRPYHQQGPDFIIDLNDGLYQPGDTVYYYFSARDINGVTNYWSVNAGVTTSEAEVRAIPCEVTCLPANALSGATDILYVDGFDGRGAQPFFETAFDMLGITPDRYDVQNPSFHVGGGPGARVKNVFQQLSAVYKKIIYNTGRERNGGISDGEIMQFRAASDDFGMLFEFVDQSPNGPGLYLSGDNFASMWIEKLGSGAVNLRSTYLNFGVVSESHKDLGEPASPLAIGFPETCFDNVSGGVDTLIAYGGGCSGVNDFDVLSASVPALVPMAYSGNPLRGAVVTQITQNSVGDTARVVLSGFSFHEIRAHRTGQTSRRADHLAAILRWLGNDVDDPVGVHTPVRFANTLAQNHPNPFNPTTTIEFTVKSRGHVSLTVYDVAGRQIRTLVSENRAPGIKHVVGWDGRNAKGEMVASGVYFYRLETGGVMQTKKMVLCK